jgi:polyhydroxyalkanoate synthesis regulator phasin
LLKSNTGAIITKTKLALAVALAVSLVASGIMYASYKQQVDLLTSESADKSKALEEQGQQILQYTSTIDLQRRQIDEKTGELQSLNSQIAGLENTVAVNELEIQAKTIENQDLTESVNSQKSEIDILKSQAARLQGEIAELEGQVDDKENQIALLIGKVEQTESQLESFKRVRVDHYSVAVDQDGVGIVLPIEVEIVPSGEGIISIDVKNVKYETGFQDAVRTAVTVASEYSSVSVSDKDIIVRVVNDYGDGPITIDGGSAGALITGMISAGLTDKEIKSSTLITGTINPDGSVGRIGSVDKKADAAADFGAKILLVPNEQVFDHESIKVIGVSNIDDVMRYLTS